MKTKNYVNKNLSNRNFNWQDLTGADFTGANLKNTKFYATMLYNATIEIKWMRHVGEQKPIGFECIHWIRIDDEKVSS